MANEGLWQQLLELDGQKTAQRAKCRYLANQKRYIIPLLNREYIVNLPEKKVLSAEHSLEAGFSEELCILTYLINSRDLPVANKLRTAQELPEGQFFFRGPHKLATEKLEEVFGQCPERLYDVMDEFGAKRCEFGDASIELSVLPRILLTIVIWRGDEEFGARASILFDETAAVQLPLDALWAAANLAIKALVKAVAKAG
ncbi:MAG: DUF3786 domain-containing protein [Sedimentisphaerales bacterium]